MRVIGHPVIFQLPGVQVEPKNHPAGPPTEAGTDAAEFPLPVFEAAEGLSDRLSLGSCGLATAPEVLEIQFVQRSEEHTSELQSQSNLVCRLLLEKKKKK